ncbi:MAG TPA: hypothetical protein PKJ41_16915 [Bryobacteraceae bacterium]|nr:hypothetical protein [Bryobacteraceae bacterium]
MAEGNDLDLRWIEKSIRSLEPIERIIVLQNFASAIKTKQAKLAGEDIGKADDHLREIVSSIVGLRSRIGEGKACAMFDFSLRAGHFDAFESPVVSYDREFNVSGLRIDQVLHHEDGSVTAVEIKPRGVMRDMSHGIGQSLLYAALMAAAGNERVRPALFIPGPRIEILAEAARLGGVQFLHTECSVAATEVVMELLKWVES